MSLDLWLAIFITAESYKCSSIINYDSRVVVTSNLSVLGMTLKLLLMIVERFYDLGCPVIANFFDPQLC